MDGIRSLVTVLSALPDVGQTSITNTIRLPRRDAIISAEISGVLVNSWIDPFHALTWLLTGHDLTDHRFDRDLLLLLADGESHANLSSAASTRVA